MAYVRDDGARGTRMFYALGATPGAGILANLAAFNPAVARLLRTPVPAATATTTSASPAHVMVPLPAPGERGVAVASVPLPPTPPHVVASPGLSTPAIVLIGSGVLAVGAYLLIRHHKG